MSPTSFSTAPRLTTAVTASLERRCLLWLAERLPPWVSSDQLTVLALGAMAAAGFSFWAAARIHPVFLIGVVASLAINWFGDSLDGTLARVRHQQRPRYGFYVDHVIDCFGACFLLGGLAVSGYMSPMVAMGLLIAYLMLTVEVYLATYCLTVFRLSWMGFGPTELRIVLSIGTLALLRSPRANVFGGEHLLFDVGGVVAIVGITVALLASVVRNVRALYLAEPLPPRTPGESASQNPMGSLGPAIAPRTS
jgi:phosphatidylglycerophosphate synthase